MHLLTISMRRPFGDKGDEKFFEYTTFLVFVQCFVNSIFMIISRNRSSHHRIILLFSDQTRKIDDNAHVGVH
jgi:preprotein translocase subunit SecG